MLKKSTRIASPDRKSIFSVCRNMIYTYRKMRRCLGENIPKRRCFHPTQKTVSHCKTIHNSVADRKKPYNININVLKCSTNLRLSTVDTSFTRKCDNFMRIWLNVPLSNDPICHLCSQMCWMMKQPINSHSMDM